MFIIRFYNMLIIRLCARGSCCVRRSLESLFRVQTDKVRLASWNSARTVQYVYSYVALLPPIVGEMKRRQGLNLN